MEDALRTLDERIIKWDKKDYRALSDTVDQEEMDAMIKWLSTYAFYSYQVYEDAPHLANDKNFILYTYIIHWLFELIEDGEKGSIVQDLLNCYLAFPF